MFNTRLHLLTIKSGCSKIIIASVKAQTTIIGGDNVNTLHFKYAVEVAKTGSITLAAEKLYMNQPNLSKAIKEL